MLGMMLEIDMMSQFNTCFSALDSHLDETSNYRFRPE
jgi:hypothetical protein